MRFHVPLIIAAAMILSGGAAIGANVLNYADQGGSTWHVGGDLQVESGGAIDVESGGALKLDGTAVTATAAEINTVADKSAAAAIAANGDTLTVTQALHAGKVIEFGKTTGTVATLPAATGTGDVYTFVIGVTATSNANVIKVANATDVMDGSLNIQQDTDTDGAVKVWRADAGDDTMSFAGAATSGGIVGGQVRCTDYKAGFWSCEAFTQSGGGAEATPFSASVS